MSFLKITDPTMRDFIVNEFLKTRQTIQQNFLSERLGDSFFPDVSLGYNIIDNPSR